MTIRYLAVVLLLVAAVFPAPGQIQDSDTVFRVDVGLVRLLATVKDAHGALVGDLTRDEFVVYDSGVEQEITLFEHRTSQPLSVALLVDTSASTGLKLGEETSSVIRFLNALFGEGNPDDAVTLYSFSDDVTLQSSFTRRLKRLESRLSTFKADSGTSLYDAIYFSSHAVERRDGRRVLVVVTDGADTTSVKSFQDATEAAQQADAIIYGITIIPVMNDPGRHIAGENALFSLAEGTGGRAIAASLGDALDQAFDSILNDLRTQYLIAYYPRDLPYSTDRFRRVEVKVTRPDLRVVTRTGYYEEYGNQAPRPSDRGGPSHSPRHQE